MTGDADPAPGVGRLCAVPPSPVRPVPAHADPNRKSLIRLLEKKWLNGTLLKYHFMRAPRLDGPDRYKDQVRKSFDAWKNLGIGLTFEEVDKLEDADIRIAFEERDEQNMRVGRCGPATCLQLCMLRAARAFFDDVCYSYRELNCANEGTVCERDRVSGLVATRQHSLTLAPAPLLTGSVLNRFGRSYVSFLIPTCVSTCCAQVCRCNPAVHTAWSPPRETDAAGHDPDLAGLCPQLTPASCQQLHIAYKEQLSATKSHRDQKPVP